MGRPSGWRVSYASLIGFTLAGLKAYVCGWAPAQRTWSKRTFCYIALVKLAYNPRRRWWSIQWTASNKLGQYTSSLYRRAYCYAKLAFSSLAVIVTIASTYVPTHREMARLSFLYGCLQSEVVYYTKMRLPISLLTELY